MQISKTLKKAIKQNSSHSLGTLTVNKLKSSKDFNYPLDIKRA